MIFYIDAAGLIKQLSLVVVGLDTGPCIIIYYTLSTCVTRRMHLIINALRFKGYGTSEAHLMIWWWTPLWMAQWKSLGWIIQSICWYKPYPTINMAKYLAIRPDCLSLSVWYPTWPPDACLLTQWHWEVLSTCMDTYQSHTLNDVLTQPLITSRLWYYDHYNLLWANNLTLYIHMSSIESSLLFFSFFDVLWSKPFYSLNPVPRLAWHIYSWVYQYKTVFTQIGSSRVGDLDESAWALG